MHPRIYESFVSLFEKHRPPDGSILEIGASSRPDESLLSWFAARGGYECTGIDLKVGDTRDVPYRLLEMNSNDLSVFPDSAFQAVISNAVLEHDKSFWLTLAEVRRVLAPGGYFFVGTPGYPAERSRLQRLAARPQSGGKLSRVATAVKLSEQFRLSRFAAASTLWYHAVPRDYYRFSEDAFREVFLEGMDCMSLSYVLTPVRILAVGRRISS
jgi:SAM-dependent methyltransferase